MDKNTLQDRLRPLLVDSKWERLEDFLNYERSCRMKAILNASTLEQLNRIQGEVHLIDLILNLPNTLSKAAP